MPLLARLRLWLRSLWRRQGNTKALLVERALRSEYKYICIIMDATQSTYEEAEDAFNRAKSEAETEKATKAKSSSEDS